MPCTPGMRGCQITCRHRELVQDYRLERWRQEQAAEQASAGYRAELADYLRDCPLITFQQWLTGRAMRPEDRDAAA